MRAFLKYLIEAESKGAELFLPAMAVILTILLALFAGAIPLGVDRTTLYRSEDNPPYALAQAARDPRYADIAKLAGQQDTAAWLKAEIEGRLLAASEGGVVVPVFGDERAGEGAANPALQLWINDYVCPVKGWRDNRKSIRTLVWLGLGRCGAVDRWTARVPALYQLGAWPGLLFLIAFALLTLGVWYLTFSFQNTRSAYRWLYRSRVF